MSLLVVVGALALVVAWPLAWCLSVAWTRLLEALPPARALGVARWGLALLAAPLLLGALVGLGAVGVGEHGFACHCAAGSVLHLCAVHPEYAAPLVPLALVVWLVVAPRAAVLGVRMLQALRRSRAIARHTAGAPVDGDVVLLDLGQRNAFTLGLHRSTIVADAQWWRELSETERAFVRAHERAHVRRRDTLALGLARVVAAWLPPSADAMVRWWQAAAEHEADRHAALALGDPLDLADFLLRELRAGGRAPALAFHGTATERRIAALAECELPRRPPEGDLDRTLAGVVVVVACGALFGAELHHLAEQLLSGLR